MNERRLIDGHVVEIGDNYPGAGKRIRIDYEDVTDDMMDQIGEKYGPNGMRVPHSTEKLFAIIELLLQSDS